MKYLVRVFVSLKPSILDPQGRTVQRAVEHLGHSNVSAVRVGKLIELMLEGERDAVEAQARELAGTVLSNPGMEDYRVEVEPAAVETSA